MIQSIHRQEISYQRRNDKPDWHFHNVGALKSVVRRSWSTLNSLISWLWGSKIVKGPAGKTEASIVPPFFFFFLASIPTTNKTLFRCMHTRTWALWLCYLRSHCTIIGESHICRKVVHVGTTMPYLPLFHLLLFLLLLSPFSSWKSICMYVHNTYTEKLANWLLYTCMSFGWLFYIIFRQYEETNEVRWQKLEGIQYWYFPLKLSHYPGSNDNFPTFRVSENEIGCKCHVFDEHSFVQGLLLTRLWKKKWYASFVRFIFFAPFSTFVAGHKSWHLKKSCWTLICSKLAVEIIKTSRTEMQNCVDAFIKCKSQMF